jgi:hypothetical protein
MVECAEEIQSQHHRAPWFGFGTVGNNERVVFAIFEKTPRAGSALSESSFENNKLKKNNQSLARGWFVTRSLFDRKIVRREVSNNGALIGIAWAEVSKLREIQADVKLNARTVKVRALCILDRVEKDDCDGHAAMGYEETGALNLSLAQLGTVRKKIRYDLANTFSKIAEADNFAWPRYWDVFVGRIRSILRVCGKKSFEKLWGPRAPDATRHPSRSERM